MMRKRKRENLRNWDQAKRCRSLWLPKCYLLIVWYFCVIFLPSLRLLIMFETVWSTIILLNIRPNILRCKYKNKYEYRYVYKWINFWQKIVVLCKSGFRFGSCRFQFAHFTTLGLEKTKQLNQRTMNMISQDHCTNTMHDSKF